MQTRTTIRFTLAEPKQSCCTECKGSGSEIILLTPITIIVGMTCSKILKLFLELLVSVVGEKHNNRMADLLLLGSGLPICFGDGRAFSRPIVEESRRLQHSPRALCVALDIKAP